MEPDEPLGRSREASEGRGDGDGDTGGSVVYDGDLCGSLGGPIRGSWRLALSPVYVCGGVRGLSVGFSEPTVASYIFASETEGEYIERMSKEEQSIKRLRAMGVEAGRIPDEELPEGTVRYTFFGFSGPLRPSEDFDEPLPYETHDDFEGRS